MHETVTTEQYLQMLLVYLATILAPSIDCVARTTRTASSAFCKWSRLILHTTEHAVLHALQMIQVDPAHNGARCTTRSHTLNKSTGVQLPTSAVNVTLLAFAAECNLLLCTKLLRRCCCGRHCRSISCRYSAQQQTANSVVGKWWDKQTDARRFHRPCSAYYVRSVKKKKYQDSTDVHWACTYRQGLMANWQTWQYEHRAAADANNHLFHFTIASALAHDFPYTVLVKACLIQQHRLCCPYTLL